MTWSPASTRCTVRHWKVAMAPSIRGTPLRPSLVGTPRNLSSAGVANWRDRWGWSVARMFTAKCVDAVRSGRLGAFLAGHQDTSGGSSDTDVNEFAVTPILRPSGARAVITVTPVAYWPRAFLNSRGSKRACSAARLSSMNRFASDSVNHHGNTV